MNGFVLREHREELVKIRDEILMEIAASPKPADHLKKKIAAEAIAAAIRLCDRELAILKAIKSRLEDRRRLL